MSKEECVLYPEGAFIPPNEGDYLFVVDVQNDFLTGSLGSEEAQKILKPVLKLAKSWDWQIVYTKDTHDLDYLKTQEGKNLPIEHCIVDTAGWCLPDELQKVMVQKNAIELRKSTFGAFDFKEMETNIGHGQFKNARIFICGLCTDICVISNALILKAKFPEHEIICFSDACAGVTIEKHEAALKVMESCQIKIMKTTDLPLPKA